MDTTGSLKTGFGFWDTGQFFSVDRFWCSVLDSWFFGFYFGSMMSFKGLSDSGVSEFRMPDRRDCVDFLLDKDLGFLGLWIFQRLLDCRLFKREPGLGFMVKLDCKNRS